MIKNEVNHSVVSTPHQKGIKQNTNKYKQTINMKIERRL